MLTFEQVTYAYPGASAPAVRDISLTVAPGELVLCTGPSGCGKSTLIRLANGLCPHFFHGSLTGEVQVQETPTTATDLHDLARHVGTLFQDPENQFFALTVEDELAFSHEWRGTPADVTLDRVRSASRAFGLDDLMGASILDLSEGQKQKVALASIISLGPGVIILDEPSANLDPEATAALARELERLKAQGMAILVVDHRLYWLADVADRVLVMGEGRIVAEGGLDILRDDEFRQSRGLRAQQVPDPRRTLARTGPEGVLRATGLCFAHLNGPSLFQDASFALPPGVTGVIGDNGAGKTTLARLLTGLNRLQAGELRLHGQTLRPEELLRRASIVLQNTDHQLHMHTVRSELAMSVAPLGRTAATDVDARVNELLGLFNLTHLAARHPQSLSGGEKQRLVIACGMAKKPEILILDEPTSGLDGRNMALVAQSIRTAADQGAVVLLISHDLELMALTCDTALCLPLCATNPKETSCSHPS